MQKIVTIRASQDDLESALNKFTAMGWRVLSTAKGSEWGRIGFSYNWTVVLEINDNEQNVDEKIDNILQEYSSKSYVETALAVVAIIVGVIIIALIAFISTR